jgi:hypothetical protein
VRVAQELDGERVAVARAAAQEIAAVRARRTVRLEAGAEILELEAAVPGDVGEAAAVEVSLLLVHEVFGGREPQDDEHVVGRGRVLTGLRDRLPHAEQRGVDR